MSDSTTKFKGPGQWHAEARKVEQTAPTPKASPKQADDDTKSPPKQS
jgi:hypothetical protein